MNARSTVAVVGLCGNESTTTRGFGCARSHASSRFAKRSSSAPIGTRVTEAPGEDRPLDVDRVARARHEGRVARLEQHPHQVREALLGADRVQHLRVGIELDAELALVERSPQRGGGSGSPSRPSSGGCAGSALPRASFSTARSGEGRSGLPKPRSTTSSPPRRSSSVRSRIIGEDVRRQAVDPAELHRPSLVRRSTETAAAAARFAPTATTSPTTTSAGDSRPAASSARSRACPTTDSCSGSVPREIDGRRRRRGQPGGDEAVAELLEPLEPHEEHERATGRGERRVVGLAAVGAVPARDRDPVGDAAMGDGDQRRRRERRRSTRRRGRSRTGSRPRRARAPPRRRGRRRTGRRP